MAKDPKKRTYLTIVVLMIAMGSLMAANEAELQDEFDLEDLKWSWKKPVIENNNISTQVYFCPRHDCMAMLINQTKYAKQSVDCAFYDLDLVPLIEAFENAKQDGVKLRLVIDNKNYHDNEELYAEIKYSIKTLRRPSLSPSSSPAFELL